jgi:hypothetical protein
MPKNAPGTGLVFLTCGLLASSSASFVSHLALRGMSSNFASGFLDGAAVVFYCVAIWVLSRSRKAAV